MDAVYEKSRLEGLRLQATFDEHGIQVIHQSAQIPEGHKVVFHDESTQVMGHTTNTQADAYLARFRM